MTAATEHDFRPRWTCPICALVFRADPYDVGSGPELNCPGCDWCFAVDGGRLQPVCTCWVSELPNRPLLVPPCKVHDLPEAEPADG